MATTTLNLNQNCSSPSMSVMSSNEVEDATAPSEHFVKPTNCNNPISVIDEMEEGEQVIPAVNSGSIFKPCNENVSVANCKKPDQNLTSDLKMELFENGVELGSLEQIGSPLQLENCDEGPNLGSQIEGTSLSVTDTTVAASGSIEESTVGQNSNSPSSLTPAVINALTAEQQEPDGERSNYVPTTMEGKPYSQKNVAPDDNIEELGSASATDAADSDDLSSSSGNSMCWSSSSDEDPVPADRIVELVAPRLLRTVHRCKNCNKTFSTSKSLEEHQRSHEITDFVGKSSDKSGSVNERHNESLLSESVFECFEEVEQVRQIEGNGNELEKIQGNCSSVEKKPNKRPNQKRNDVNFEISNEKVPNKSSSQTNWYCRVGQCSEEFYFEKDYANHQKLHRNFNCFFCETVKDFAADLAWHEILEHSSDRTKETIAKMTGKNLTSVKNKDLRCPRPDCSHRTGSKDLHIRHHLTDHLKLVITPVTRLTATCKICKVPFCSSNSSRQQQHHALRKNQQAHFDGHHNLAKLNGGRIQRCDQKSCPAYFLTASQLRIHKDRIHQIKKQFDCSQCNKTYKSDDGLRNHQNKYHRNTLTFCCYLKDCGYHAETKKKLEAHVLYAHKSGDRFQPIKCPKCDKPCRGEWALKYHLKSHEQSYVCEHCGKGFKNSAVLQKHYLSHSGPDSWEYLCSICSKKCTDKHKLAEHMRTHTKEKPFVCQACGEKYAHRHNLRNHVNSKHGNEVQDVPRQFTKINMTSRKGVKRK